MKDAPHGGAGRGADGVNLLVSDPQAFRITTVIGVNFGSKKAEIVLEIENVGTFFVDYFRPANGPFVAPRSIRSRFSGAWERTFRLDDELAMSILEAVKARLAADNDGEN